MSEIDIGDCVTFLDGTGCRRVGDVAAFVAPALVSVRVPGFRDPFIVARADLALHAQPGSR